MRNPFLFCAVVLAAAIPSAANAVAIQGLFNTGVDAAGAKQDDGFTDPHWLFEGGSATTYHHPLYVVDPNANFITGGAPGTYTLDFYLTGVNIATAQFSGRFAVDNGGTVFLNGTQIASYAVPTGDQSAYAYNAFMQLHDFSANSGFVAGRNTLSFVITDYGLPSAMMVTDFSGTADLALAAPGPNPSLAPEVPEPATWAMSLAGFGLLGAALRRRRTAVAFG